MCSIQKSIPIEIIGVHNYVSLVTPSSWAFSETSMQSLAERNHRNLNEDKQCSGYD
jgi:hypothetical protein